ncbi:MAG TPA: SDR family NAD(P)-dependent oxidoreductase [Ktedonobacterales bacterium]|jgi:NAD(P)-dependent dehydrogenase (short-subunit alcohol dehydrogenase family)|nr:SDR family NAD(P)-dependent oxidoreductase [Ktedonobacterales bacterium]
MNATNPSLGHQNHYDLRERVALVAGASGGLGQAVCVALLVGGAQVVALSDREHPEERERLRAEAGEASARLRSVVADARDEQAVSDVIADIAQQTGRLDILVNLIGGFAAGKPVTELDSATFERMLGLNLRPTFLLSKYAAREMARRQWGRIINTSSRSAYSGRRNAAAYAVAKAGVITLTETQAEETRDQRITVNALLPSIIDTPANRQGMPKANFENWPKPEEIARVIAFLASDDAALISGASIPVYGLA